MTEKHICRKINIVSRLFRQQARKEADNIGLNSTYFSILPHLANNDNLTQSDLVQITHLKAPTISLTIKNMMHLGYIEKVNDKKDQRQQTLHLTKLGYQLDEKLKNVFDNLEKEALSTLTDDEVMLISQLLEKIKTNIERID